MGRGNTSLWLEATVMALILAVALSILSLSIKDSLYVVFPVLGISGITSLLIAVIRRYLKGRGWRILTDQVWRLSALILLCSLFDSIAIWLIRLSTDLNEAMFFNGFQIFFTASALIAILYFTLSKPRYLMEKEKVFSLVVILFLFYPIFFSTAYFTNVFTGRFQKNLSPVGGIYSEIDLSEAGLEPLAIFAGIVFMVVVFLIILSGTLQCLRIKNRGLKRYYSVFYGFLMGSLLFEILAIFVFKYLLKITNITFFGAVTLIFSYILIYYIIHVQGILTEIGKLGGGGSRGEGEMLIFPRKEEEKAKEYFRSLLEKGKTGIIFSTRGESAFEDLEKYRKKFTFIRLTPEGYRVGHSIFRSTEDIEEIDALSSGMGSIVIYSDTLEDLVNFPCEKRGELIRYYRFLLRFLNEGGTLIAPISDGYLLKKRRGSIKYPLWIIKPIVVLRLEEAINLLYSRVKREKRSAFIKVLRTLEKDGMPEIVVSRKRICLNLLKTVNRERFSLLIERMGDMLEEKKIMDKKRYKEILVEFFEEYGDESLFILMAFPGELNFVALSNARERGLRMAISLLEERERGLIISRVNPHILRKKYDLPEGFTLKWLTTTESGYTLYPHLEEIKREIFSFLDEFPDGVVVLDGAEYLQRIHGFEPLLNLFWILQDRVSVTEAIVLIPINLDVMDKKDVESLKRDFRIIE